MIYLDINTRDETKKQINEECISIYKKKIQLYNTVLERMNVNSKKSDSLIEQKENILNPNNIKPETYNIKYELVEDLSMDPVLGELNTYIPNFMFSLWKDPKIICKLLLSSNPKDIKDNLSSLFCNNFFENILSPNYIENNLLFLITLLLKEEIFNFSDKKIKEPNKIIDNFLKDSPCSFILEQFNKKKDVQIFFKTILLNIIEDLELSFSNKEMIFDLNKIEEDIQKKVKNRNNSSESLRNVYNSLETANTFSCQAIPFQNNFYDTKIFHIDDEYFESILPKYKSNNKMVGYILSFMGETSSTKERYCPEKFINKKMNDIVNQEVIKEYQKSYDKTINLIDELFQNLLNYLYLLPYSIKCICKIIFLLIQKKFRMLNIFHQYAFMAKFFFEKLFSPIFQNPGLGAFINTFIISTTTIKNLETISKIINTFVLGNLFKNNKEEANFTPFNNYFLSKMPDLFVFFEGIIKVELPLFIEKYINDQLPEDFEYDYFQENVEEVVLHKSICFTIDDLYLLLELMEKNKKSIFSKKESTSKNDNLVKLEKTFEKLGNKKNKELIKKLKNNAEYEMIDVPVYNKKKKEIIEHKQVKGREIIKYYLISNLSFNKKYTNIFNVDQDIKYFSLPELTNIKNEEDNMKNNIIKVKNFFCIILYNYRMLVKTDFEEGKTETIISILKEIKQFMKSSNNVIDGNFPSLWFLNSLLDYLEIIPKELVEDDCELLINEIEKEINKAIKKLDFVDLSVLIDKMKFAKRGQIYYENSINLVIDINLNKRAQTIVEEEIIEVEILIKYNDKNKELKIEPPNKNEKHLYYFDNIFDEPKKKPSKLCSTVKIFTKFFPDLIRYAEVYNVDVFQMEQELNVPQKINGYFKLIKNHIKTNLNITDEKEFSRINDKIDDYIMEKLYDKIFPKEPNEIDKQIFENCEKLSWVEPKHFIASKNNYVYDSFLPELTKNLILITKEKSVRKKISNTRLIFESMNNLGEFNGEGNFGIDDQMQILNYVFIKANPSKIYSNCQFMELFIGDKNEGLEGQNLVELKAICEHVANLSSIELKGINKEDFNDICLKSKRRLSTAYKLEIVI